jgi:hypothetical protein
LREKIFSTKNIFETVVAESCKTASDASDTSDSGLKPLENSSSLYAHLILVEHLPNLKQTAYYCKEHPNVPCYYDLEGIEESHFKPVHGILNRCPKCKKPGKLVPGEEDSEGYSYPHFWHADTQTKCQLSRARSLDRAIEEDIEYHRKLKGKDVGQGQGA